MASSSSFLAVTLGTQNVGMARFQASSAGALTLESYAFRELTADPAADATRMSQTSLAIGELTSELGAKRQPVYYAVPGHAVFARFVKLPNVAEEKVEQLVGFEAQQNVPFPINEVVWDYQLLGGGNIDQTEVALVAIKSDILEDYNDAVTSAGLKTAVVEVAPAALYNAFRFNYSSMEGCSLLIDLGARTTNLLFIEGEKFFSRNISIGGATITGAIAKELGEAFPLAEKRKREDGFVSLGGAYAEPNDPMVARMSKIIRNSMTKVHSEINRSISFYRSQQGGSAPLRVYLSGGASGLPYMREFFQEKLQLPIDFFNPLRNVAVSRKVDVEKVVRDAHLLGELIGTGLRGAGTTPLELNLRPASVERKQTVEGQAPFLIAAGLFLLAGLAGAWLYFSRAEAIKTDVVQDLQNRVSTLQSFESQFRDISQENELLQTKAKALADLPPARDQWLKIIDDINQRLPDRFVWVVSLTPTSGGAPVEIGATFRQPTQAAAEQAQPGSPPPAQGEPAAGPAQIDGVTLSGLYLFNEPDQERVVTAFAQALMQSPYFNFNLERFSQVVPVLRTPDNQDWAFPFEMRLPLTNPLPLP
ncbi:MAG: Amuc_1101 family PilM-like pilus complex protein [Verrucomicrobiales bacterium]